MDNLIGQRFSLISKSEIRYVGTLHEINPEQSTIALEDVFSFGTEDRQVASFIPPSQQKFEYIVFRGSDVKDIKIEEEEPKENKQQQQTPNDPAILNSSRPAPPQASQGPAPGPPSTRGESPFPPPPNFPPQGYGGYYGPPPGQFGRGYGPPPPGSFGPGPGYPPYGPPPPGYYGPPGQNFPPQGPGRFPPQQQQHPPPIGPPGSRPPPPGQPQQQPPSQNQQQPAPAPGLPMPAQATAAAVKPTPELPVEKAAEKSTSKPTTPAPQAASTESPKPTTVPAPATLPVQPTQAPKQPPTQPKGQRITPAMPFAVNQKSFIPPVSADTPQGTAQSQSTKPIKTQAEMDEASRKAKQAVENALANLNSQSAPPAQVAQPAPPTVDNITERMSQISTGPPSHRGQRGGYRGQRPQRTSSGGQRQAPQKMEIPQSDFDFESANAKFNKEDLIKEAIASGSPISEDPPSSTLDSAVNGTPARKDSYSANPVPAYNKSSSFFDNISSEAKDREDARDVNGRALRGAEFKKNVETFGQGNVDSGYRGRGRGGYRGQRRGYGGNRDGNNSSGGYRGGYRGRGRGDAAVSTTV